MKPIKSFLHIMLLLITVSFTAPVFSQSSQYALYNYRNDGNFNAWLNLDIEKITYSCIDTLGVEHDDIVVQEVWTADSVYRIPLEAIDSIGFRAPAPVMREGIFYLDEYHAAHTLEIDSLTLYFDTSIDRDRLPSLGQVVLHNTFTTPYEEGFAGRVKTIEEVNGRIKIDCEMLCVGDVYKHLVLVGSAKTMTDEEADVASARTRGDGDPWIKYEEDGEMPIRKKIGDLTFTIFDGLISVVSKDPTLQVKYTVYVDEDIYHISANCQLNHDDLQYGVNLNFGKLCEIDDTIKVDKELKEITQALKRLQDYKEMSADEWVESFLNEKIQKGNKEKLSDDETKLLGGLWDKLHGSWTIPIGGPFVLDLELGPLFKPKGSLELSFMAKTKARNTFYVEARGYTMATLANPRLALATGLAHIDGYSNFHSEPISSLSLSAKAKASLSIGIIGKVSVSLIHKSIVHATVSGQGGLKLGGSLEAKWDSESWYDEDYSFDNFYDYFDPLYDALKDTKVKAELFANFGVELGLTPWSFLSVGAEWEAYNNELGSCYLFPHFSKPSFPVYYHDKEQWSNGNFNNHLILQSLPTKNIPELLLGPCNIGMRIIDEEGKTVRETEDREYRDDGTIIWQLYPLEIDLKGLEPGKTYRCYPILHYHDWYKLRATPSYEFTVPEPVSVKQSSLSIKKGDTKDITVSGGWGCYEIINDKNNIVTAYFSDEGEVTNSGDSNNSNESGGGGGGGSSWTRSSNDVTSSGGAGGGVYDWGPSLIWTSSWPTDETPTLHIEGTDVGEATVQVKDMRSNETTSIKVVVTDEEITSLELSSTSLALSVGKDGSVDITSGSGEYTAESSDTDVATVEVSGSEIKVTAIKAGTATITVTDTETSLTANIEVEITEEEETLYIPVQTETFVVKGVLFTMVAVEGGSFLMGSPDDDPDARGDEKPQHRVELSNFAIGQTEVTNALWKVVMGDYPSDIIGYKSPVNRISRDMIQSFISKLNALTGRTFRLPTEAEWEYAARGGKYSQGYKFAGSDDLDAVAWFKDNSGEIPHTVAQKKANELGLYDMSGNVWELCQDYYDYNYYRTSPIVNPCNTTTGSIYSMRGGGVSNNSDYCRNAFRSDQVYLKDRKPVESNYDIGIRLVVSDGKTGYNKTEAEDEAYAVYDNGTLSFYCDADRFSKDGETFDMPKVEVDDHGYFISGHAWNNELIKQVVFDSSFAKARPTNTSGWFKNMDNITKIEGLQHLNTSEVLVMEEMFSNCTSLKSLDVSFFDTSKTVFMDDMFNGCSSLTNLDVSHFNTPNVKNMTRMFRGCSSLICLDVSNFDTSKTESVSSMFYGCNNLKTIYCGDKWNLQNIEYSSSMFEGCTNLIGGKGTKYDLEHTDAEYARIDGGLDKPGYFTEANAVMGDEDAFCLSESSIDIYVNTDKVVDIKNGSGEYEIINDYPDIIAADINGIHVAHSRDQYSTRTIVEYEEPIKDDLLYITGKKIGNAVLKIKDKSTDKIVSIDVAVINAPSLTLAKNNIELSVGNTENVEILTGSEWYEVTTDQSDVVSVHKSTITSGGAGRDEEYTSYTGIYAVIEALSVGEAVVTVKDLSSGETVEIKVKVS